MIFNLQELSFGGSSLLQRVLLIGVAVIATIGFGWMLRPSGSLADDLRQRGPSWIVALAASRGAVLLLGLSLAARFTGRQPLADLLTEATLFSLYGAAIVYAVAQMSVGLVALFLRTPVATSLRSIRRQPEPVLKRTRGLIHLAVTVWWIWFTLTLFQAGNAVAAALSGALSRTWSLGTIDLSLGAVLAFVVTLWLAVFFSQLIRAVLEEDVLSRLKLPRGVPGTVSLLVRYALLTWGFALALGAAGIELSQFALLAGALGVGIGFGLQDVVRNFVAGLILAFERPIQIGDVIEIETLRGRVRNVGIRSSVIRTFDGSEVIIPNDLLISGQVTNWTLSDRARRIGVEVGVQFGTNPHRVIELLTEVAKQQSGVIPFPQPSVLFLGFGESSLDFVVRAWTDQTDSWFQIRSELMMSVHDALEAEGIEIPFPQRVLHLREAAEGALTGTTSAEKEKA